MERNFKNCRVILEQITPKSNMDNKRNITKYQESELPVPPKNLTFNLPKKFESFSPCVVKLENMNFNNVDKKLNDVSCTPQGNSKHNNLSTDTGSNSKVKMGVTFEPLTPKAQIEFSLELKKAINERNILTSKTRKRVFEALDEIKSKTEEERRTFKREKALLEIINSEIKYVHQLEIIINFFMKPTKEHNLLKPEDYDILFRNINTIYSINKELLDELDKGVGNVANAFSKIAPFLKLYSMYAYEFKGSIKILQNASLLYPQFAKFIENQETRPEVQNKLSALLITPIQRVPRYKLLLTTLYNLSKPSEEGFDVLSDCLEKIEEVAEHINKIVDDQENTQRLLEFQRCLCGEPNVITPGRKLIKEGTLTKMSSKNGHSEKLYVVLMNDIIMFSKMKKNEPKVNSLRCSSIFPLNKCKILEILDKGCLKITCQEEELILYHNQFNETKNWISKIKKTIEEHLKDRKTLRKESSSRRPVKRKDLHEYHEIGLSPGRPLRKRRLEPEMENAEPGPSRKILKRKPIRPISKEIFAENKSLSVLRPQPTLNYVDNNITENGQHALVNDLYIFGKPSEDKGFKLGKLIGEVGSTIKRFLGFKN